MVLASLFSRFAQITDFRRIPLDPQTNINNSEILVVEMRGIVKRFPGVLANDHVDFELQQGKSTPCWGKMEREKVR